MKIEKDEGMGEEREYKVPSGCIAVSCLFESIYLSINRLINQCPDEL